MRFYMKKSFLFCFLSISHSIFASTLGNSALHLWQIKYSAPTRFADGYTVTGTAQNFNGSFTFDQGHLESLTGSVPVLALSSGLASRDASIRELVFGESAHEETIEFRSDPTDCTKQDAFWVCNVTGYLKIRNEWQPLSGQGYISDYQGRLWLHAEGSIQLSKYSFYASGPAALKVADRVDLSVDLLGPE